MGTTITRVCELPSALYELPSALADGFGLKWKSAVPPFPSKKRSNVVAEQLKNLG